MIYTIVMGLTFDEALNSLERATGFKPIKNGRGYLALCPNHGDTNPSLGIDPWINSEGNKTYTVNCFKGCYWKDVKKRIEEGSSVARIEKQKKWVPFWEREIVETYPYTDEKGNVLYEKVRFTPKSFAYRHATKYGKVKWGRNGVRQVLYQLPKVIKADTVFIVEGEKNVFYLESLGSITATCIGGASDKWLPEFTEILKGKKIIIIPDNDEAGIEMAERIKNELKEEDVNILHLNGLAYGQDVADWVEMGHDIEDLRELYLNNL